MADDSTNETNIPPATTVALSQTEEPPQPVINEPVPLPVVWFRENSIPIACVILGALVICLVGHYSSVTVDWTRTKDFTDAFRNVTQGLAFIAGGIWAYFKLKKGRGYKESLIPAISGKLTTINDATHLIINTQVKNVGQSIIKFAPAASSVKIFEYIGAPPDKIVTVTDAKLTQFDALHESDRYIEPNEIIEGTRLIVIPNPNNLGFRLELEVISSLGFTWRASSIVQKATPSDNINRVLFSVEGG